MRWNPEPSGQTELLELFVESLQPTATRFSQQKYILHNILQLTVYAFNAVTMTH